MIRQNGGLTKWFDGNREVVLYYLRLSMEVYSVLKDFGAVDEKVNGRSVCHCLLLSFSLCSN